MIVSEAEFNSEMVGLPIGVTRELIRAQILSDKVFHRNNLEIFLSQLDMLQELYGNNPEYHKVIQEHGLDMCQFTINVIEEGFDIHVDIDYSNIEETMDIARTLYNYFVVNLYDSIKSFVSSYVDQHRKEIANQYPSTSRDVTTNSVRNVFKGKTERQIVANIPHIVNDTLEIASSSLDPIQFLDYNDGSHYEPTELLRYYEDSIVSGDFVGIICNRNNFFDITYRIIHDLYYEYMEEEQQ